MAINRIPEPHRIWAVSVPVQDEQMGDILSTTDDHFGVVAGMRFELLMRAREIGRDWLVRADASLVFPRVGGAYGSLFPDLLLVQDVDVDVPGHGPYRIHEVGKPPDLLVEILSDETAKNDVDAVAGKLGAYAQMGVREYLTFDPRPRRRLALVGYRLARLGEYAPIPPAPEGGLWLETVALRVVGEPAGGRPRQEPRLRFFTAEGRPLLHADEVAARGRSEETARLRAEREQRREEAARRHAEQAQARAEQAQARAEQRAEQERAARLESDRRAAALEAQVARLRAGGLLPADDSAEQ